MATRNHGGLGAGVGAGRNLGSPGQHVWRPTEGTSARSAKTFSLLFAGVQLQHAAAAAQLPVPCAAAAAPLTPCTERSPGGLDAAAVRVAMTVSNVCHIAIGSTVHVVIMTAGQRRTSNAV